MEIRPHPDKKEKAVVTVDSQEEMMSVRLRLPKSLFRPFRWLEYIRSSRPWEYPYDIIVSHHSLGHIASKALVDSHHEPRPEDLPAAELYPRIMPGLEMAKLIFEYFEGLPPAQNDDQAHRTFPYSTYQNELG